MTESDKPLAEVISLRGAHPESLKVPDAAVEGAEELDKVVKAGVKIGQEAVEKATAEPETPKIDKPHGGMSSAW